MIINIDELIPSDKKIKLHDEELIISGELSVKEMLKLIKYNEAIQNNPLDYDVNMEFINLVYDLLKAKNPKLDKAKFVDTITLREISELTKIIFSIGQDESNKTLKKNT